MENTNLILAENIQKYRIGKGLTQSELAERLGVTFQAVSKWENARSAPDIFLLPIMADVFDCKIDELFSNKCNSEIEIPFEDDGVIRIFQAQGKRIIKSQDDKNYIEVKFPRDCNETTRQYFKVEVYGNIVTDNSINGDVICHGSLTCHDINGDITVKKTSDENSCTYAVTVEGNIAGECSSDSAIAVGGSVAGGCNAGRDITVGFNVSGGVNAAGAASVTGNLSGGCNCAGDISCQGDINGDVNSESITVQGNVEADKIKGNVICNSLSCDRIDGNVTINKSNEYL